ncbi:heme ABC exporter ATP-binding protein CcmA [Paenibacillus azoreducens]|uniref:heme ABC exporter ATP-binding protein CcmA n=1 Tax=Paenibacillus azoreducens TaxID=116718 RepID=UPI0039F500DB
MDKAVVVVEGVSKRIKRQNIVEEISFSLNQGNILALCGGNGAGKSTLLRMITGMMQPTAGRITVNDLEWKKNRKLYAEQIGYMPDDFQFQHGLTAEETLSFWAALRKVPQERISELLEMVGLEHEKRKKVSSFSKGMRQRLLLAQALLVKPVLLMMDEPTNGLDPFWNRELIKLMKQVRQEGSAVIFSTHQLEAAETAADQVLFLNHGRNVGAGTVEFFQNRYGSLHAAFNDSLGLD